MEEGKEGGRQNYDIVIPFGLVPSAYFFLATAF